MDHGDGTFTYTHDGSETVGDSFSYTIDDVSGATSNVASVTVTVNPVNDAPTAANDTAVVNEGASVVIDLSGNDTDPDNALDLASIVITSGPANGSLVDNFTAKMIAMVSAQLDARQARYGEHSDEKPA